MSPVASRLEAMVEVPDAPLILMSPPITALSVVWIERLTVSPCNEVEAVVEVAMKFGAVTVPVNVPAPVTERGVPGVEVPIPKLPALETTR